MTEETQGPFYINYTVRGEHCMMGPYNTQRFAMAHVDDVRRLSDVSNVFIGKEPPCEKSYRRLVPITAILAGASLLTAMVLRIDEIVAPDCLGWLFPPGTV